MKALLPLAASLALGLSVIPAFASDEPKASGEAKVSANDPTVAPSLRKPGFVFMEIATPRVEAYVTYFESVAGFKVTRRMQDYVDTRSDVAELTFLGPKIWGGGHPFSGKVTGSGQGIGIEIGIVVADLDKAYAEAVKLKDQGWPISTGIVKRPWGVRDFRVLAPEGYYFRFTEGH